MSETARTLDWQELPASVRELRTDLDPLGKGVLMAHQVAWLAMKAPIKVAEKGRRTGITFAEALDAVLLASTSRSAGGDHVFYIGDTKAKGLEFIGYAAHFARTIARAQSVEAIGCVEEFLFEDQDAVGRTRQITSYRVRFRSGFTIVALSSNPANIRGLQGKVIIDEAAYHRDVQAVIDAATALLIWGGRIAIISTHNGKGNPFATLIRDIEAGAFGAQAQSMRITFDDAVANGLYERVCLMRRETPTKAGKAAWYGGIRQTYGPRRAQMREELDAIPRDGNGTCLPGIWIDEAQTLGSDTATVLRLLLPESFGAKAPAERRSWAEAWIAQHLAPLIARLPKGRIAVGQDFARHRDFSIVVVMVVLPNLRRTVPLVIEMHKVPTRQQEQILWCLLDAIRTFSAAMDASGNGATLAEYTADRYGRRVEQVTMSRAWYGQWMPRLIQWFEDRSLDLPRDDNHAQDLRDLTEVDGIPMIPAIRRKDLKDPEMRRHGDFAIALALAACASLSAPSGIPQIFSTRRRTSVGLLKAYR